MSGPQHMVHGRSRREAWSSALKDAGLPEGPCVEADFSAESGARAMRELLDLRDRPTAVVFANDLMAMAGMSTAVSRGVVVPDDLSITGFDDVEICAHLQPSLTSVHTDVVAWGRAAATRLLELIDDQRHQPRRPPGRTPRRALLDRSCTRPGTPPLNGATMKRTFLSTSAAVLALGILAACGGGSDSSEAKSSTGPIKVWLSNNPEEIAWGKNMVEGVERRALRPEDHRPGDPGRQDLRGGHRRRDHRGQRSLPGVQHQPRCRSPVPEAGRPRGPRRLRRWQELRRGALRRAG